MELSTQNQTVLVVEDNAAIRETITAILELEGYGVLTAADGVEALSALKQRQSNISLLLTDLIMPDMNGVELARRVQELDPQMPIVYIMAALSGEAGIPGPEPGCVAKPFTCSELINSVNKAIETRPRPKKFAAHA